MSGTLNHLRSMKRRLASNSTDAPMSPEQKIEMLEKGLNSLRKEMNTKMKIILEILTVRNEQVSVHKKLMDREQKLCSTLMSYMFEYDSEDQDQDSQDDCDPAWARAKAKPRTPKTSKKGTRKRRKISQPKLTSEVDDAAGEKEEFIDVDPLDVLVLGNSSEDDGDGAGEDSSRSIAGDGEKSQLKVELDGEEGNNDVDEEELVRTHPYACGVCRKRYRARTSLWRHTRFECTTISPNYYCSLCPASTKRRDNFLKHLKKKHMILADKNSCLNYVRGTFGDDEAHSSLQGMYEVEDTSSTGIGIPSQQTPVTSDEEDNPADVQQIALNLQEARHT